MAKEFINLKKLNRDLFFIEKKLKTTEDIATTRALNIVVSRGRNELVDEVVSVYDYPKNSIKRRIRLIKATRNKKNAGYFIRSTRAGMAKPRKLKQGISVVKAGRKRTKITHKIRAGSTKPFLITAKAGGNPDVDVIVSGASKKIAVYRKKGFKRKVTTMYGPSVRRMVETVGIGDKWLFKYLEKNLPDEYSKQLKKAKFRGKRG
jgi:hypothetical protein